MSSAVLLCRSPALFSLSRTLFLPSSRPFFSLCECVITRSFMYEKPSSRARMWMNHIDMQNMTSHTYTHSHAFKFSVNTADGSIHLNFCVIWFQKTECSRCNGNAMLFFLRWNCILFQRSFHTLTAMRARMYVCSFLYAYYEIHARIMRMLIKFPVNDVCSL